MTGVGQGIKLVGSKISMCTYLSVGDILKLKVVRSSVMLFTVCSTLIIYSKGAKKGAPHL